MTSPIKLTYTVLETGPDGRSRFRDQPMELAELKPLLFLSTPLPGGKVQLRYSPVGYSMSPHSSASDQWTFVLQGVLELGVSDGTKRLFRAGEFVLTTDVLPAGAIFDPALHGHSSRNAGDVTLVTALVRD